MSNPELSYLCLICCQVSPELAFCSEECRSLAVNRTRRASEPSPPTIALIKSLSDMCQLHPLPEAIDFDRWIAETEGQKPKPYNPYNINFGRPDQMSEQAVHKLKEYELSFDQTRWLKMQASELFRLGYSHLNENY
jgi:galactokinase